MNHTGDLGETALNGGPRVGKDHYRIEALGAVDELTSALGVARAFARAAGDCPRPSSQILNLINFVTLAQFIYSIY